MLKLFNYIVIILSGSDNGFCSGALCYSCFFVSRALIQQMIKDKEVPAFDSFTKEKKAKKQERKKRVSL